MAQFVKYTDNLQDLVNRGNAALNRTDITVDEGGRTRKSHDAEEGDVTIIQVTGGEFDFKITQENDDYILTCHDSIYNSIAGYIVIGSQQFQVPIKNWTLEDDGTPNIISLIIEYTPNQDPTLVGTYSYELEYSNYTPEGGMRKIADVICTIQFKDGVPQITSKRTPGRYYVTDRWVH